MSVAQRLRKDFLSAIKATSPRLPRPGVIFTILVLVAFTIITSPFYARDINPDAPTVQNGEISLGAWTFTDTPLSLEGDWQFFWDTLYYTEPPGKRAAPASIFVPAIWDDELAPNGAPYPQSGVATYRLLITDVPAGKYQLFVPALYVADKVWLDGMLAAENGTIGRDADTMKTVWGENTVNFVSEGGDHEIVIEVSSFQHRSNGLEEPPLLAPEQIMEQAKRIFSGKDMLFQAMLLLLSVYGFTSFFYRPSDLSSLYFGLFCVAFMFPTLAFGTNFLIAFWPEISFRNFLLLMYIPGCLTGLFFTLYVTNLNKNERIRIIDYAAIAFYSAMSVYFAFQLANGNTLLASQTFPLISLSALPLSVYLVYVVVRASLRGRDGALLLLVGLIILSATFLNDALVAANLLRYEDSFGIGLTGLGLLVFLLSQMIILSERWSKTLVASEQMTKDLSQLVEMSSAISSENNIEDLLYKIVHSAAEFLEAERGSLFIYDDETDELWSIVAEGLVNREIRVPSHEGIVGHCFQTGNTLNVKDAYKDERFISSIDTSTGFVTHSILSMPVESNNGRRLGVMQVLNKKRGAGFTPLDISRLRAFAAQAAISLENVELFSEVSQARNYNDSILSSMSSGVVTINARGIIEKLNDAALGIFGGAEDDYVGQAAESTFQENNPWLSQEVSLVRDERKSRILIDVDFVAEDQSVKSVNLSIVPLEEDEENIGSLILFDDITSEKRLKGTMSRFMTKEVADQVMNSDGDVLSGALYNASVMFSDIRNFTGLSEKLGPRETVSILNNIFSRMVEEIFNRNGVLDKFIGDAIMAIYGAPVTSDKDAENAVQSAIAIKYVIGALNEERRSEGLEDIRIGIGIGTGDVIAGTIGSPKRMEYTVIGDSVNLAARLEALTKYYAAGIIICSETLAAMGRKPIYRELDLIRVRGQSRPVQIFQVLDYHSDYSFPNIEEVLSHYAQGLQYWRLRNWEQAASCFELALELNPEDRPTAIHLERCRTFMNHPPDECWDGVWDAPALS